ncbi:MAG: hypothetical protein OQL06_14445 [Gammaproteobacteria bacterium]|nr:hypothetical protein [Gammaproteobacteria bacterium]
MGVASILRGTGVLAAMSIIVLSGCSGGGSSSTSTVNCTQGTGANITISGTVTYDHVHHNVTTNGLDYSNTTQDPVRGATVEAVCNGVIASTKTDINGNYTITAPGGSSSFMIRAVAEMVQTGTPSWNFTVVDNTQGQAIYSMETVPFDMGSSNITKNLNASSGWGGTYYTGTRVAAPFAILDSVYVAFNKVLSVDATANFQSLKLNWSVNNVASSGSTALGQITTSHFNGTEIFILGDADNDTDEYDGHVIVHEWGHYFEEFFSRSDSIGGSHSGGDILDIRVAFGEGWGNAFSGMATDDQYYRDSYGIRQSSGFDINVEGNNCTNAGWYNECSVQSILYDLYDSTDDGGVDNLSMGFNPIYTVLTGAQKNTPSTTSIFSFISNLRSQNISVGTSIDNIVGNQNIDTIPVIDSFGDSEIRNNPGSVNQIPVHTDLGIASTRTVCSTSQNGGYNGLGVHRFLNFTATNTSATIIASGGTGTDPDIQLFRNGQLVALSEVIGTSETMNISNLVNGAEYVVDVYEYSFTDPSAASATTCFTIDLN